MKKLAFAALVIGGLMQASGCVIVTDDDPDDPDPGRVPTGDPSAQFDVAWDLIGGCPDGATTIQIVSDDGAATPFEDLIDCTPSGSFTVPPLPLGVYDVYINVTDDAGNRFASSLAVEAELVADGEIVEVPTFTFPTDSGYMALTWDVIDDATNEPLTCAEVGADDVVLSGTVVARPDEFYDFEFPCEDFEGVSGEMPIDDYTLVVWLSNAADDDQNNSIGTSQERDVSITYGNELVDLGNFDFAVQF